MPLAARALRTKVATLRCIADLSWMFCGYGYVWFCFIMWSMLVWFNLDAVLEQSEVIDGGWILISAEDQAVFIDVLEAF